MYNSRLLWLLVCLACGVGCGSGGRADSPPTAKPEPAPPPRPVIDNGKLYAVLIGDTNAAAVVPGFTLEVERNLATLRRTLAGGVGSARMDITVLSGKDAEPTALEDV